MRSMSLDERLASLSAETLANAGDRARRVGIDAGQLESRTGEVAPRIIEIAREKQADAIVVGHRGAGRIAGLLLGSAASHRSSSAWHRCR
ncbi:MAG TPA: universal stress protein [Stellaceae bacterium]|jgi:nucleotide-binding universal stress UspA family protein|nr:universal stress protein [Stellaceae bacterium]